VVPNAVRRAASRLIPRRRAIAVIVATSQCVVGCRSDEPTATGTPVNRVADPTAPPSRIPLRPIALTTYDGSGQAVHPDVVSVGHAASCSTGLVAPWPP
jgi:hypothetical protein